MNSVNRRTFSQRRAMHEIVVDINGFMSRLTDAEGAVADLEYAVGGLDLVFVSKDGVIASINASPEEVKIAATNITLEGIVTANNYFKILEDGSMEAANGKFSGEITADTGLIGRWEINADGLVSGLNQIRPDYARFGVWYFQDGGMEGPGVNITGDTASAWGEITLGGAVILGYADGGIDVNGVQISGVGPDVSLPGRLYMDNPPTASGTANVRLVDTGGTYSLGIITSSRLFKKDIDDTGDFGSIIDMLRPIVYTSTTEPEEGRFYGLIAEEVADVDPLLVDYRHYDGESRPMSVQYDRLTIPLLQAVQDLRKRMAELEVKTA
jgi:hypothetical protein